ncbi:MAG: diguanylate cyclase [Aliarcobacter sp.]|nr:diguanylate cyclase [Aliarcobacter sp.]
MKNKNFLIFLTIITIIGFTILIINYLHDTKNNYQSISEKILFQQSSTLFNNIVTIRKWNSDHGSIYVKAHKDIKPNPYLVDNHTFTKDNELLIKINPAWMTRQLSELSNKNENFYFKIISSNPINPNNYPDKFEKDGLENLSKNKNLNFYTKIENEKYNLIGPLKVELSCLQCHGNQGYKIGDIIVGLRVSVPIDNYIQNIQAINSKTDTLYFVTLFISFVFILIIIFIINSIYSRESNIIKLNKTLEKKVFKRTKELRNANKKLLESSTIDYLTNIPNRRHLFEIGSKYFHLSKRQKNNLSVIYIDIDFFKKINDTYGHDIGDEILKMVANTLAKQIRKSDLLARTGGEEFIILLNNMDESNAFLFAENIRNSMEKVIFKKDNISIKITISLGISQLKNEDENLDSIIKRADEALYQAKKGSRNKSVIYS